MTSSSKAEALQEGVEPRGARSPGTKEAADPAASTCAVTVTPTGQGWEAGGLFPLLSPTVVRLPLQPCGL